MPVAWSSGWLFQRMLEFEGDATKWNNQPIGFGLDDADYDPAFDAAAEPPPGWESLPMIGEVVSDGE
jgi:hypothetical protein